MVVMATRIPFIPANLPVAAVARSVEKLHALVAERDACGHRLNELRGARGSVEAAERQAFSVALAEGKPDPGMAKLEAHDAAIAAEQRRYEAFDVAVASALETFTGLVEEHRDELMRITSSAAAEAQAAAEAALDQLEAAVDRREVALGLHRWSRRYPHEKMQLTFNTPVLAIRQQNGDAMPLRTVLAALRDVFKVPEEQTATNKVAGDASVLTPMPRSGQLPRPERPQPLTKVPR